MGQDEDLDHRHHHYQQVGHHYHQDSDDDDNDADIIILWLWFSYDNHFDFQHIYSSTKEDADIVDVISGGSFMEILMVTFSIGLMKKNLDLSWSSLGTKMQLQKDLRASITYQLDFGFGFSQ